MAGGGKGDSKLCTVPQYGPGDEVQVTFDCENGTIEFMKNEEKVGKIVKLKDIFWKDQVSTWTPALQLNGSDGNGWEFIW